MILRRVFAMVAVLTLKLVAHTVSGRSGILRAGSRSEAPSHVSELVEERQSKSLFWLMPHTTGSRLSLLAITSVYVAFQKKLLGKKTSKVVARLYFWPTIPFTIALRWGNLVTKMDDTLLVGVAPVGWRVTPQSLHHMGVRGVINLCDEFRGPQRKYANLGVEELWLPTIDHFEPSVEDLCTAIQFIERYKARGERVYVHCKAGHGRSAAVVFCWLATQMPDLEPEAITRKILIRRKMRKRVHMQNSVALFLGRTTGAHSPR